jgi:exonuclease SbcD
MRFLHTADWHVGKTLKGRSRLDEQRQVLAEIVDIARANAVDAVLIAGDVYDSSVPSAEAQRLVVRALLDLRDAAGQVIAIAGNHDHASMFDAYRPVMDVAGITLVGAVRRPDQGGVIEFTARSTGELVRVAVLPFLSQRYAVSAAELVAHLPADNTASYDQKIRSILGALTTGFTPDAVNVVMAHLTVTGGAQGGGERTAQSIFEYHVSAAAFPVQAHYVALGHLHRRQALPAACPVHYSGAPIAIDFGEQDNTNVVCLVEASPGTPARVTDIPTTAGRRLRTIRGTVAELVAQADAVGDDYLRVDVQEPARAGLREEIQAALPNTLEVRIAEEFKAAASGSSSTPARGERSPAQLFDDYCDSNGVRDPRLHELFVRLHDQVTTADSAAAAQLVGE